MSAFSAALQPATPLEACAHRRISASAEVDAYLHQLVAAAPGSSLETWGHSVNGRPLRALLCGSAHQRHGAPRLKLLLIGSQHGASEPAGCEALLLLARDLLLGDLRARRQEIEIVILPNANPDGRDSDNRHNANGVNLNRDYALLSQPESQALNAALLRHRPHVVLDAHESAALKRKTLWREGYLTEFEAQFDIACHPAIAVERRHYAEHQLLGAWCEEVRATGLHADRYIGELTSTRQALTHGGLSIQRLRNKAGVLGSLSFLLETRLDPSEGSYSSYRNIAVRTAKQLCCMRAFLALLAAHATPIQTLLDLPTAAASDRELVLDADYVAVSHAPISQIPLRRAADNERVMIDFKNHRQIAPHPPIALPAAYLVTAHMREIAEVLQRHGLHIEVMSEESNTAARPACGSKQATGAQYASVLAPAGALRVPTAQPHGVLAALLLETGSSSLFAHAEFEKLLRAAPAPFVYRLD